MDKIAVAVVDEDPAPPELWEVADVAESMNKLLLSSSSTDIPAASDELSNADSSSNFDASASGSGFADDGGVHRGSGLSEDDINRVDQFLRDALQNPRERLSVLRMERDVEKFIRDILVILPQENSSDVKLAIKQ